MLKVRGGHLDWTQILRSNDFFRGTPYNFIQFTTLQELMAGWVGVVPGNYTHISDSLHVYESDLQFIGKISRSNEIWENTDSLIFNMQDCLKHFQALEQVVDQISTAVAEQEIIHLGDCDVPKSLANFVSVFVAERLRQLDLYGAARKAVQKCTNPYLIRAWAAWADHF
jgi:thymidylate synthase